MFFDAAGKSMTVDAGRGNRISRQASRSPKEYEGCIRICQKKVVHATDLQEAMRSSRNFLRSPVSHAGEHMRQITRRHGSAQRTQQRASSDGSDRTPTRYCEATGRRKQAPSGASRVIGLMVETFSRLPRVKIASLRRSTQPEVQRTLR